MRLLIKVVLLTDLIIFVSIYKFGMEHVDPSITQNQSPSFDIKQNSNELGLNIKENNNCESCQNNDTPKIFKYY